MFWNLSQSPKKHLFTYSILTRVFLSFASPHQSFYKKKIIPKLPFDSFLSPYIIYNLQNKLQLKNTDPNGFHVRHFHQTFTHISLFPQTLPYPFFSTPQGLRSSLLEGQNPKKRPNFMRVDRTGWREAGGAFRGRVAEEWEEARSHGNDQNQAVSDRSWMGPCAQWRLG